MSEGATSKRTVLVVAHTGRLAALRSARLVVDRLTAAGVNVRILAEEAAELKCAGADVVPASPDAAAEAEMVIVLGGDGTLLRAAEIARPAGSPMLGVNLGHVGFLAETEPDDLAGAVDRVVEHQYTVEERMTVEVTARHNGTTTQTWALNEASVEKSARERMIEVVVEIDGRPLSHWACDGVVCDGVRVLRGRPHRLAAGGGAAHGADQRPRPVRRSTGGVAGFGARRGGHRLVGRPGTRGCLAPEPDGAGRFVVRWAAERRSRAGSAGGGAPRQQAGPAGPAGRRPVQRGRCPGRAVHVHRPACGQVRPAGDRLARTELPGRRKRGVARRCLRKYASPRSA
jgi:hypothetical protein